jgi:hypothetical protein
VKHEPRGALRPSDDLIPIIAADNNYFVSKWLTGGLYMNLNGSQSLLGLVEKQYSDLRVWVASQAQK